VLLAGLAWVSGWASTACWANFQVRNFRPGPVAGRVVLAGRA